MGTDGYQINCINTTVMITGIYSWRQHRSQALILQPITKTKMRQKARDLCQVSTLLDTTFSARLQQDSPRVLKNGNGLLRERYQLSTCCMHCVECLCCCIIPSHARPIRQTAKQRRQTARQWLVTCAMNPLWMVTNQNPTSNWVTAAYLSSPGWSGWVYFEL